MNPLNILVVEDDDFLASAYRVKLSKEGHNIAMAKDGQEALDYLNATDPLPQVVLLDLVMPVKDGFTTLEEIRATEKLKTLPVIVTSNLGQDEDIQRALGLGANDYIIKSDSSIEEIIEKIMAVL